MRSRRGAVLIVVVGLAVMLFSLLVVALIRIRAEGVAARALASEAQTRTLIAAACQYVLETSRIGWGQEAYGWRDIRDGSDPAAWPGPRGRDGSRLYTPGTAWPNIGGVVRCPMFLPAVPPYATKGRYAYNPVPRVEMTSAQAAARGYADAWDSHLGYRNLSPQPYNFPDAEPSTDWSWGDAGTTTYTDAWNAFRSGSRTIAGDPTSLAASPGSLRGWFRILRTSVDTFILSAGSGATQGFRDWTEVTLAGEQGRFFNNAALFDLLHAEDRPLWYEVQWSSATGDRIFGRYAAQAYTFSDPSNNGYWSPALGPPNLGYELAPHSLIGKPHYYSQGKSSLNDLRDGLHQGSIPHQGVNQTGTLTYLRRLFAEPAQW